MNKIKMFFVSNGRLLGIAFILGFCGVLLASVMSAAGNYSPHEIIRLHIVPNSDSARDQAAKFAVRDEVLEILATKTHAAATHEEMRGIIAAALPAIESAANYILHTHQVGHRARVYLAASIPFPAMSYGGFLLPRGHYESLQIIIGEGVGGNWWCVIFPNLCLVDITIYGDICNDAWNGDIQARPRFFAADLWARIRRN